MFSSRTCAFIICFVLLVIWTLAAAPVNSQTLEDLFAKGITVDLRDPLYAEGVLSTEKGGVITGPDLRIQALKIRYTRKMAEGKPVMTLEAEDQLIFEYGNFAFIGSRVEYDFQTREGIIYDAKSAIEPWYFGGAQIELKSDGSISIQNGFITTSPNADSEWKIYSRSTRISENGFLSARNVRFDFFKLPLFWLPSFRTHLDFLLDPPIRYRIRWGGEQGPRVGMIYKIMDWNDFRAFLRFDYRLERGPGGGLETEYESPDQNTSCYTINYLARDNSIEEPEQRTRYRFEGVYDNCLDEGKLLIHLSYDRLSDKEMPTDYYDKGLDLKTAGRTQLNVRRQYDDAAITNFFTRVRINSFQTVKQELPVFSTHFHPLVLGDSGIMADQVCKIGYLDLSYADDLENVHDYNSGRLEARQRLWRPFLVGPIIAVPEAKAVGIFYSNSQEGDSQWLGTVSVGGEVKTSLVRHYSCLKHTFEPYARYQYLTAPSSSPNQHYIFDLSDGWARINTLRLGTRHLLYTHVSDCFPARFLTADFYTYAFFDTPTIPTTFQKVFGRLTWDMSSSVRHHLEAAWDFQNHLCDHVNFRTDVTIDEDLAFSFEYRHRSKYAWRKVDPDYWNLESFRSQQELLHSLLSDRRDTLLGHVFYRFLPNLACEFQMRHGWNRRVEPGYWEYQIDLLSHLRSTWDLRLSYQKREDDHRVALYVSLVPKKPK